MSSSNEKTLASYEEKMDAYMSGTPQEVTGDIKNWIDETISQLPSGPKILELGSGFGRDAAYIESKGFSVQRTDATVAFVEYMRNHNYDVKILDAIKDVITEKYDLIFADAVLLHFTKNETEKVIKKIYTSLNKSGIFSFTLKRGKGEEWSNAKLGAPRYFCYWEESAIKTTLEQAGFSQIQFIKGSLVRSDGKWIHIIAKI